MRRAQELTRVALGEWQCVQGRQPLSARTTSVLHTTHLYPASPEDGVDAEGADSAPVLRLQPFPGHQSHIQAILALGREGLNCMRCLLASRHHSCVRGRVFSCLHQRCVSLPSWLCCTSWILDTQTPARLLKGWLHVPKWLSLPQL